VTRDQWDVYHAFREVFGRDVRLRTEVEEARDAVLVEIQEKIPTREGGVLLEGRLSVAREIIVEGRARLRYVAETTRVSWDLEVTFTGVG
jgi:hypothetical protein